MATLQILVLSFQVRILVGQRTSDKLMFVRRFFCFIGSVYVQPLKREGDRSQGGHRSKALVEEGRMIAWGRGCICCHRIGPAEP